MASLALWTTNGEPVELVMSAPSRMMRTTSSSPAATTTWPSDSEPLRR